jgi:scyllo-inositol 2-dehydrogenase (NADP+)
MLRVGLVGYGFAGATFHAPLIEGSGRASVAVIVTSQAERARADWPGARITDAFEHLLADAQIPLVVIATPNDTHFDYARRALEAGKHVVVDKPVTLSAAQAQQLAALAAARGLLFAPFHNRRWDGDFLTVKALLARGALGRITYYESHFDRFRPLVRPRWREEAARGGGLLYDLGPHLIDQALVLFGAPQTVYANVATRRDNGTADDVVHLLLGYAEHDVVLHASVLAAAPTPRYLIHGTRGSYAKFGLDGQEDQLKAGLRPGHAGWGSNPPGRLQTVDGPLAFDGELATLNGEYESYYTAVADSIEQGVPFPVTPAEAVDVMTVIELARASHEQGRRLPFERAAAQ